MNAPKTLFEAGEVREVREPAEVEDSAEYTPIPDDLRTGAGNAAFGRFWNLLEGRIVSFVRMMTRDYDKRDDLIAIAMVYLWRRDLPRFDPRDDEDLKYLYTMVIRRLVQAHTRSAERLRTEVTRVPDDLISLFDPRY